MKIAFFRIPLSFDMLVWSVLCS